MLTKAQAEYLHELSRSIDGRPTWKGYKPANNLIELGLAEREQTGVYARYHLVRITSAGKKLLEREAKARQ